MLPDLTVPGHPDIFAIGDTVTITVHAAQSAVPDIDDYLQLLDAAL